MKAFISDLLRKASVLGVGKILLEPQKQVEFYKNEKVVDTLSPLARESFFSLISTFLNQKEIRVLCGRRKFEKQIPFSGKMIPIIFEISLDEEGEKRIKEAIDPLSQVAGGKVHIFFDRGSHFNTRDIIQKTGVGDESSELNEKSFEDLMRYLIEQGGSDIFLIAGKPAWIKINEDLYKMKRFGKLSTDFLFTLYHAFGLEEPANTLASIGEFLVSEEFEGIGRFRLRMFQKEGEFSLFMRRIPAKIPDLADMGFLYYFQPALQKRGNGLFIVGGPSGSGKTTTITAIVNYFIQNSQYKTLLFEDPIEYQLPAYAEKISYCNIPLYRENMKEIMDEIVARKAKVLVFPEIYSSEISALAVKAAAQGYYVIGGVIGNNSIDCIKKIDDLFPVSKKDELRQLFASHFLCATNQRLAASSKEKGVIGILEMLHETQATENIITSGKLDQLQSVLELGSAKKMITLKAYMEKLKKDGFIHGTQFLNLS
ncbi:ATPase, T2SS/T4P/T4SS family [Candidatus Riflebacteria bacterium]